eukprot:scaffold87765_cov62-Phaeocystis_antarctica.AAC.2
MARGFLAGCGSRAGAPCSVEVVALAAVGVSAKKAASGPSDCFVTSTWPDGRTEERECQVMSDAQLKPS